MRRVTTGRRAVVTAGCALACLLLGGIPRTMGAGTDTPLPTDLITSLWDIRNYFCDSECDPGTAGCQPWPSCPPDRDYDNYSCQKAPGIAKGECDSDQDLHCLYDGASVCVYSRDFAGSCMYRRVFSRVLVFCVCDEIPVRGQRCSEMRPPVTTRQPTTASDRPEATAPPPQANVEAIAVGSALSAVLLAGLLAVAWLCWTKKLTFQRRSQNTAGDASDGTNGKDKGHSMELQPRELDENADHKADSTGTSNAAYYKSLELHQDHYYSKIPEKGDRPGEGGDGHAQRPSAPPIGTGAPADHHYFVLERDGEPKETHGQAKSSGQANNHEYFVLEDDSKHGPEENVHAAEGATPRATSSPPASADESYDHIRRSRSGPGHSEEAPSNQNTGYEHLHRPGQS